MVQPLDLLNKTGVENSWMDIFAKIAENSEVAKWRSSEMTK